MIGPLESLTTMYVCVLSGGLRGGKGEGGLLYMCDYLAKCLRLLLLPPFLVEYTYVLRLLLNWAGRTC